MCENLPNLVTLKLMQKISEIRLLTTLYVSLVYVHWTNPCVTRKTTPMSKNHQIFIIPYSELFIFQKDTRNKSLFDTFGIHIDIHTYFQSGDISLYVCTYMWSHW
jgi:hypothetical protein